MKVGLVGLGRMGSAIAQRLGERGCEVIAWDQNSKAMAAQGNRVRAVGSPRAVAESADVVLSIITEDKGVRRVFTGAEQGSLAARPPLTGMDVETGGLPAPVRPTLISDEDYAEVCVPTVRQPEREDLRRF